MTPLRLGLKARRRKKELRGRPPNVPGKPGVSHLRREVLKRRFPVLVTMRVREHVWNLRSQRCFRALQAAFRKGRDRFGFQLSEFSVQGNHLHFIVEAEDEKSLARGVQGLTIRMAKALNRVMGRRGKVFTDRYHARILRSPTQTAYALRYVHTNYQKHMTKLGQFLPAHFLDPYSSATRFPDLTQPPRTWLLQTAAPAPS